MRILYDGQIFENQKIGGISRYFFELMSAFNSDPDISHSLPILYSDNVHLKELPLVQSKIQPIPPYIDYYKNFLGGRDFRLKLPLYSLKNKISPFPESIDARRKNRELCIEHLKRKDFDVFHPTYYDGYFLEFLDDKPFVLTVYDLIHQIFPEFLLYDNRDKNAAILEKANQIIAISESTKQDLIHIFGIDEQKIAVTHLGNSLGTFNKVVSDEFKAKIPSKYLLFVGNRGAYKNFLFFAQLMSVVFKEDPDLHVVCTGPSFNDEENYLFRKIGFVDRFHQTFVEDEELIFLYQHAAAFIFPSQYEGFGLPIVEAFSLGCPVLASNTSSLAEIGGDAVTYFEPKNPGSMLSAIRYVLWNHESRDEKIQKGFEEAKKFTWKNTAIETKEIYKNVLKQSNQLVATLA